MIRLQRAWFVLLCCGIGMIPFASRCKAASISVDQHDLLPNQAGQLIPLMSVGDEQVRGFNLRAQIGDGSGPLLEPVFDGFDFTNSIWDAFPAISLGGAISGSEQFMQSSVVFEEPNRTTTANGVIGWLSISTIGIEEGVFDLKLAETEIGEDSDFVLIGGSSLLPNIVNGSLRIIPEPSGFALVLFGCFTILAWVPRGRH